MTSTDKSESVAASPKSDASEETRQIHAAVSAALDRKAEELLVLDLGAISDFTDYFLLCNGTNERQVQAIADHVIRQLREGGLKPLHVEGLRHGRWILLDYGGDLVIHIFLDETRRFYALERLWADAPDITSKFVQ